MKLQRYFGDRDFLRRMLTIALPILLQELLVSSFSLVDTLMISQLGSTTALAAVGYGASWNNLITTLFFGLASGGAIFFAQYWGSGDRQGIYRAYGLALTAGVAIALVSTVLTCLFPEWVLMLFTDDPAAAAEAVPYFRFVGLTYPALALNMVAGTLLRSTERPIIPLIGSAVSVLTNIFLNYSLIFGRFGMPRLELAGAAIGSAVSAWVNLAVLLLLGAAFRTLAIAPLRQLLSFTRDFARSYFKISLPVLANEGLWAAGVTFLSMVYGHIGTNEFAALTAFRTVDNFTITAFIALSHAAAAIVGKQVGAGDLEAAYRDSRTFMYWTPVVGSVIGLFFFFLRHPLAGLFEQPPEVHALIVGLLVTVAFTTPVRYFPFIQIVGIFRAGGEPKMGALLDFVGVWVVSLPIALICGLWLRLPFLIVYAAIVLLDALVKTIPGTWYFVSRRWIRPVT